MNRRVSRGYRLYTFWRDMRSRCNNPRHMNYDRYGGRGIKVCKTWNSFQAFEIWAYANGYTDELTLDRIRNNGDYKPSNCKWSTRAEQSKNTCRTIWIGDKSLRDVCDQRGLKYSVVAHRLRLGHPKEIALSPLLGSAYKEMRINS